MFYSNILDDRVSVIIDGFPSDYWKMCLSERPSLPVPERQTQIDEVLGRLGAFYTKFGYKDMEVNLTFNYLEDVTDFKAFKQQFPHIRKWLEYGTKLEFSDEQNVYYLIQSVSFDKDVINDMIEYGEFTVKLVLAPFGRVYEETPIDLMISNEAYFINQTIFNASVEDSSPLIRFNSNNSIFDITITNLDTNKVYKFSSTTYINNGTTEYTIDCTKKLFYYDSESDPSYLNTYSVPYGFPKLASGENKIQITNPTNVATFTKAHVYRNMLR